MKVTIYHNPRCRKSREALEILQQTGHELEVVEYLKSPVGEKRLKEIVQKLGIKPEELLRKGEDIYKTSYKDKKLSDGEWIKVIAENPILMERPVVVTENGAVIARPVEKVNELL